MTSTYDNELVSIGIFFGFISLVIGFVGTIIIGEGKIWTQWQTIIVFGSIYVISLIIQWIIYAISDR